MTSRWTHVFFFSQQLLLINGESMGHKSASGQVSVTYGQNGKKCLRLYLSRRLVVAKFEPYIRNWNLTAYRLDGHFGVFFSQNRVHGNNFFSHTHTHIYFNKSHRHKPRSQHIVHAAYVPGLLKLSRLAFYCPYSHHRLPW